MIPPKTPSRVTVVVDTREKTPLLFPNYFWHYSYVGQRPRKIGITAVKKALPEGDYLLKDWELDDGKHPAIVERKGSWGEIHQNLLTQDRERAAKAFRRLCEATDHPYLLIEERFSACWKAKDHIPNPEMVMDRLMNEVAARNLRLIWLPGLNTVKIRRRAGEAVVRILLAHAMKEHSAPEFVGKDEES